jgi:hypothetical protein
MMAFKVLVAFKEILVLPAMAEELLKMKTLRRGQMKGSKVERYVE